MWHLITAPILLPMLTALVIMLPPVHYSPMRRRWVSMISSAVQLVLVVVLLLHVQQNGLLHRSCYPNKQYEMSLQVGQQITVIVKSVDSRRQRIALDVDSSAPSL